MLSKNCSPRIGIATVILLHAKIEERLKYVSSYFNGTMASGIACEPIGGCISAFKSIVRGYWGFLCSCHGAKVIWIRYQGQMVSDLQLPRFFSHFAVSLSPVSSSLAVPALGVILFRIRKLSKTSCFQKYVHTKISLTKNCFPKKLISK